MPRLLPTFTSRLRSLLLVSLLPSLAAAAEDPARGYLHAGAQAMGGEEKLRALQSLRIHGVGHWYLLEQSERPEPPYAVGYEQLDELRDLQGPRVRQVTEMRAGAIGLADWTRGTLVMADTVVAGERGGKLMPGRPSQLQDLEERLALAPERVLLTALSADGLKAEPDTVLQGVPHHVVAFHWKGSEVRLFLNVLDLNRPIVERLMASPHRLEPDALARKPRAPVLRAVSGKTVVGSGPNRIELYPIRSESGERMVMAYFPQHRLLYSSDLAQQLPSGEFFAPQYLSELADAVKREGLSVERLFGMHLGPTAYEKVTEAVTHATASTPVAPEKP